MHQIAATKEVQAEVVPCGCGIPKIDFMESNKSGSRSSRSEVDSTPHCFSNNLDIS